MDKKCEENKEERYTEVLQQCQGALKCYTGGGGGRPGWITRHLYQEDRGENYPARHYYPAFPNCPVSSAIKTGRICYLSSCVMRRKCLLLDFDIVISIEPYLLQRLSWEYIVTTPQWAPRWGVKVLG